MQLPEAVHRYQTAFDVEFEGNLGLTVPTTSDGALPKSLALSDAHTELLFRTLLKEHRSLAESGLGLGAALERSVEGHEAFLSELIGLLACGTDGAGRLILTLS